VGNDHDPASNFEPESSVRVRRARAERDPPVACTPWSGASCCRQRGAPAESQDGPQSQHGPQMGRAPTWPTKPI